MNKAAPDHLLKQKAELVIAQILFLNETQQVEIAASSA